MEVPRYDEPRVRPSALPGVRPLPGAPLDSFGGGQAAEGVFRSAGDIAHVGSAINEMEFSRDLNAAEQDYLGKLSAEETRLKLAMANRKGKDAAGATDEALVGFDRAHSAMDKEISNPLLKQKVRAHYQDLRNGLYKAGEIYTAEQNEVYAKNASKGLRERERDAAITDYIDPENPARPSRVMSAIGRQRASVADDLRGQSEDYIKAAQAVEESKTHSQVLDRMLAGGNDSLARTYYEANQAGFFGDDKIEAEKKLQHYSSVGDASRLLDAAFNLKDAGSDLDGFGVKNTSDLQNASLKIEDPRTRQEFLRLGRQRLDDYETAAKQQNIKDAQDAFEVVEATGSLDGIPPDLRMRLKPSAINQLEARARDLRRKAEPVTIWEEYTKLRDMAADPETRQKFLEIPPMNYRNFLNDTDYKEVLGKREGLLKGDDKTIAKMKGYRTISGIVGGTLAQSEFGDMSDSDNKVAKEAIERIMDEEVKTYQSKNKGEDPDNEWVQKKVDALVTKTVLEPNWFLDAFRSGEPGYKTTGDYLEAVNKIPPDERDQIEQALRKHGQVPTRRRIIELYTERHSTRHSEATEGPSRAQFIGGGQK